MAASKRPRRNAHRALGYLLIPLTGLLSPLIALPAITAQHGAAAWAALAIGQSVGTAAAAVGELGWGLNGPQRVARMAPASAFRTLLLSMQSKLVAVLALSPIVGVIAFFLAQDFRIDAAVIAIASLAAGLSSVWFYLGRSRPWAAILTDGAPRLVGVLVGALLVMAGASLMVYAVVALLIPCIVAPLLGVLVAHRGTQASWALFRPAHVRTAVFAQSSAFTARLVSATYIALPVALVSIVAPGSVPVFAAGERLMRLLLAAMAAVPNGLQGWVGSAERGDRWGRVKKAILLNAVLGLAAAVCFALLAPFASELMFSGTSTIPSELAWIFGGVIVFVSISRATGNIGLVALARVRIIMWSALGGAIVGVPAIFLLARFLGVIGGALGELIAEAVVLGIQIVGIAYARRK
ncbi:O-antigen/teichoic acid export membrane protein [Microbacterium resistens]|uniref:O-antigen/teichoic acid export membrane protein n=1 Tax=Microbacterium resistens TaxID=156977 RepID=A0ABU1SCA7_9MICO|nr:hypothetical protein [Microbacterium resistens]MDR6867242.1 O-antigen/teichoic acid export membrane protein [Microbacterium resistens]